jgi:hypothetical protein
MKRPRLPDELRTMLAKYPACRWCNRACVGRQVDGEGQPAHFACQLAFTLLSKPHPHAVPINPRLPHAEHQGAQAFSTKTLYPVKTRGTRPHNPKGNA